MSSRRVDQSSASWTLVSRWRVRHRAVALAALAHGAQRASSSWIAPPTASHLSPSFLEALPTRMSTTRAHLAVVKQLSAVGISACVSHGIQDWDVAGFASGRSFPYATIDHAGPCDDCQSGPFACVPCLIARKLQHISSSSSDFIPVF